jgi:nitrite reductase (NADH) large subunit
LRTQDDATTILAEAAVGRACVCIGGGVLGLETAGAIARQGGDITLIESHEWLMPRQLNRAAGERLAKVVSGMGIKLRREARTVEILGDERASAVALHDGTVVAAEVVIVATGVRPNSYLARRTGLDVNKGVVVNSRMQTSAPDVYAAGDVAEHHGALYGTWAASQFQGSIAGMNAAGSATDFGGLPRSNSLKVLGLELLSIGQFQPEDGSYVVIDDDVDGAYSHFVFHDGALVGCILFGDTSQSAAVKKAIETRADFSALLGRNPGGADVLEALTG